MIEAVLTSICYISPLLIIFTFFLVADDRAFSQNVRVRFHVALAMCLLLICIGDRRILSIFADAESVNVTVVLADNILRTAVLAVLATTIKEYNKIIRYAVTATIIVNIIFAVVQFKVGCIVIFVLSFIAFVLNLIFTKKTRDKSSIVMGIIFALMIGTGIVAEIFNKNDVMLNDLLGIIACVYYFFHVMATYKRDGLTGLFIRHNLNFELQDLVDKEYDVVLIDVDNFKLINDKYGHDKGDEALVTIVNTVSDHLLKGCRMYRFGGDEFVIISRKVTQEELKESLEDVNTDLSKVDLHISFGIIRHNKGEASEISLNAADKAMYENKRMLKSESIWDDMTGLYNYRGFLDEMDSFRKAVDRDGHIICLVGIDVEHLNNINMAYGYTEGNVVIAALARVIKTSLRGRDFIGHLGSDEFVVAIEVESDTDSYIDQFITQVIDNMDSAYELGGRDYTVKLNFGKYIIAKNNQSSSEECINDVLYVKQEDKDNRRKTDISEDQEYDNQDEATALDILDHNRIKYAFQPIVSAKDGRIEAYESLMRSDTEPMMSPLKILKYADKNKRAYDVERYTFSNVLEYFSKISEIPEGRRIFINSIPGHFLNETDYNVIKQKYGKLFDRLVVEITEQREIDEEALVMLNTRRDTDGFNLAIDDYGSGCSNTNSLLRYTPEIVKLDRLLITGIDRNAKKQFFVNSIITFAKENDMLILAEGVETESELKTVIRLGVDLIQGYFTAKPSFEIIDEIPEKIKKIIVNENLHVGNNPRKVYTASQDSELSVVHLAMEDYTRVNMSSENLKISGSPEYTADMCIKVKEGMKANLTLVDVKLNSIDDMPCLDIGEGTELTLRLEGNSVFNAKGIHVPEGSALTVIGPGNLEIYVKGHDCYAIGSGYEEGFGKLVFENSGTIKMFADGEMCIGIGGGICKENSSIDIRAGMYDITIAGVDAVGIGCFSGVAPIDICECAIIANFRVNMGTVIGSIHGEQNIKIRNFNIDISGSGSHISGIGSSDKSGGTVDIRSGTFKIKLNGHRINLCGIKEGDLSVYVEHTRLDMVGEGDSVIGFGSLDKTGKVEILESSLQLIINASAPLVFGADDKDVHIKGPSTEITVNGNEYEM